MRRLDNGLDCLFDHRGRQHDVDTDLGQKIHNVLGAAVQFGMPFLTPEPFHFGNREATDADFGKRLAYFIEFERFNNGRNQLHKAVLR